MTPMKRGMDLVGAVAGLILAAPLMALAAVAIRLDDGGPVLFRQARIGTNGAFDILKLRTMRAARGPSLTIGADQRITTVGRWLRRFRIDELPQLVNVLRGDMSLVGPRPEVPEFVELYTPLQRQLLRHRPGLTDPSAIRYRHEAALLASAADPERFYREELLPRKLQESFDYASHATVFTDLGVLCATIGALVSDAWPRRASCVPPAPAATDPAKERSDVRAT